MKNYVQVVIFCKGLTTFKNSFDSAVVISVLLYFYVFRNFWHINKKIKIGILKKK